MKEIKDLHELLDIEDRLWKKAEINDLFFTRSKINLIDGVALIVGAECKEYLEMYYLSDTELKKWSKPDKEYLHHYYGVNRLIN